MGKGISFHDIDIATWIYNDITWCGNSNECEDTKCFRHISNRIPESGPNIYSSALFKGTEDCPSYLEETKNAYEELMRFKKEMIKHREETKNMTEEEKFRYSMKRWQ